MVTSMLITGASGLLGSHILRIQEDRGTCAGVYHNTPLRDCVIPLHRLDLRDATATKALLNRLTPKVIIHCAAITDTSFCERNPTEAEQINVGITDRLARWAAKTGAFLVFLSTDLVFDGTKGSYREDDPVRPLSVYAETKVKAEEIIRTTGMACVVRTSLICGKSPTGDRSANEKMMLRWNQGIATPLFVDEYRSPIHVRTLASAILEIAERRMEGTLHVAGPETLSRFDLGRLYLQTTGHSTKLLVPKKIAEVPCKPPRTPDASLDISKARKLLSTPLPSIRDEKLNGRA